MTKRHYWLTACLTLVMLNAFASNTQAGETKPHQQNRLAQIGENEMSSTENEAVIETVNHYLAGLQNADTAKEHLEQAFYSSTNLHTLDGEGNLQFMPRDALVAYASSGELPSHEGKILSVEVTNDMAFAKVHLNMPDRHFYDYLTLLKINSGWRIVSKTFTTVMK